MHIILGILGTVLSILILINRLSQAGLDLGWLNPFTWRRRRSWRNKYEGNPIFSLHEPLEVAAILATSIAKIDGEISREEKEILLSLFQKEFGKTEQQASDLLMSSIYIFGDGEDAIAKPERIIKTALEKYSLDQAESVIKLLEIIATIDSANQSSKQKYLERVKAVFASHFKTEQKW